MHYKKGDSMDRFKKANNVSLLGIVGNIFLIIYYIDILWLTLFKKPMCYSVTHVTIKTNRLYKYL